MTRTTSILCAILVIAVSAQGEPELGPPPRESPSKNTPSDMTMPQPVANPQEVIDRIVRNSTEASKNISEKKLDNPTSTLQDQNIKDLDALIAQAKMAPPKKDPMQNQSNEPSPSNKKKGDPDNNKSDSPPKQGKGDSKESRREKRDRMEREANKDKQPSTPNIGKEQKMDPMVQNSPDNKDPKGSKLPQQTEMKKGNGGQNPLVNLSKEAWGHLPEKVRQELDQYYREEFMSRYNDLLSQYYSALAERARKDQK